MNTNIYGDFRICISVPLTFYLLISVKPFKFFLAILQVQLLQATNKQDPNLCINNNETCVEENSIKFHYTEKDYGNIIRAYTDAVTNNLIQLLTISILFKLLLHIGVLNSTIN